MTVRTRLILQQIFRPHACKTVRYTRRWKIAHVRALCQKRKGNPTLSSRVVYYPEYKYYRHRSVLRINNISVTSQRKISSATHVCEFQL